MVRCDSVKDLGLFEVKVRLRAVRTRPFANVTVGDSVFTPGAPRGLELSIADGVVSQVRAFGNEAVGLVQMTAAISPGARGARGARGASGGGLFDARAKLVGITTLLRSESQSLNFAIPFEWALEALVENKSKALGRPRPGSQSVQSCPGSGQRPTAATAADTFQLKRFRVGAHCSDLTTAADELVQEGFTAIDGDPAYCSKVAIEKGSQLWARFQVVDEQVFSKGTFRVYGMDGVISRAVYVDNWFRRPGLAVPPAARNLQETVVQRFGAPSYSREATAAQNVEWAKPEKVINKEILLVRAKSPISPQRVERMSSAAFLENAKKAVEAIKGDIAWATISERHYVDSKILQRTSHEVQLVRHAKPSAPNTSAKIWRHSRSTKALCA